MGLPVVSAKISPSSADSDGHGSDWSRSDLIALSQSASAACQSGGIFYLVDHGISPALIDAVINETAQFFDQSEEEKNSIHIKKSTNHRGYGLLRNYRDWREQIHLGLEPKLNLDLETKAQADLYCAPASDLEPYWSLSGANQWPQSPGDSFKTTMLTYLAEIDTLSRHILSALAIAIDMPEDFFCSRMRDRPYLLIKAMSYLPQDKTRSADSANQLQYGVTAHCDWSWLTFLIQDQVGGLEAQGQDGIWQPVEPMPGAIVVNTGELLEIESGGLFAATPHRVINSRIDKQRYSVPVFINPALDATILPAGRFLAAKDSRPVAAPQQNDGHHVHKVIKPGRRLEPFIFGTSEWRRKAQGQWCYHSECLQ